LTIFLTSAQAEDLRNWGGLETAAEVAECAAFVRGFGENPDLGYATVVADGAVVGFTPVVGGTAAVAKDLAPLGRFRIV
jgi:hypothetical protein